MSDLIRREDALLTLKIFDYDIIPSAFARQYVREMLDTLYVKLNEIPSAERKKGKWIEISWSEPDPNVCCTSYAIQSAKCSICGKYHTTPYLHNLVYFPFCPNCGSDMRSQNT